MKYKFVVIIAILSLLAACADSDPAPTLVITPIATPVSQLPPTFTPSDPNALFFPTAPPVTVTQPTREVKPTTTAVPFGDTAVEIRYQIPLIGLDRRMQGSVSSQLIMADETTTNIVKRANQAGIILELQQVLPDLLLPVVPEGCDGCVFISFDLPFASYHNEGWLRDPVLLASLENYLSISLGPHFPPGTVAGLRRSASPFAPAHTIALTENEEVYIWLATEPEVGDPIPADPELLAALQDLPAAGLNSEYVTSCPGVPVENLFLKLEEGEGSISIVCPEFTLPSTLLPLYGQFDALLAAKLAESDNVIERPPAGFPLTAVLKYERLDGASLTIFNDGTLQAENLDGAEVSTVISTTQVLSLTTDLIGSGVVRTGLNTFDLSDADSLTPTPDAATMTPRPPRTLLYVRGPGGVYDAEWFDVFDLPDLLPLNALLAQLFEESAGPEAAETPTLDETITPEAEETPEADTTPSAVPSPSATP